MKAGIEYNQDLDKSENPVLCWGHKDLPKQKGLVTYQLSSNAVNPKKHFWTKGAIFNTARRSRNQFLYVVPPFLAAYIALKWAEDRNRYLNSKKGRAEFSGD